MTNEQTIDEIMKAPARETWQYGVKTAWYTLDQVTSALAAKDEAMSVMEAESAAMADALKRIAEAMGLGIGHTAEEIVAAVVALQPIKASPEPGEWIEWKGGECPIADGVKFQFKFRDGSQDKGYEWTNARDWIWADRGYLGDIVAYRVLA